MCVCVCVCVYVRVLQPAVRTLTAADIASGKYSVFDVVYPVPGAHTQYPTHRCGRDLIDAMLAEDGLAAPDVWAQRKHRDLALSGTYRPLLNRATDVKWDVVTYSDPSVR